MRSLALLTLLLATPVLADSVLKLPDVGEGVQAITIGIKLPSGGSSFVSVGTDGHVTYGPGYTPDVAAKAFWDAVEKIAPQQCAKDAAK